MSAGKDFKASNFQKPLTFLIKLGIMVALIKQMGVLIQVTLAFLFALRFRSFKPNKPRCNET